MKIGSYQIDVPVVLAPMAGVTDLPFRQAAHRFRVGLMFGEMQASDPKLRGSNKSRLRLAHSGEPLPRAIQLVGHDPRVMADAARFNVDAGAGLVDINMGCPAKKVCRKAAGSALLGDVAQVTAILKAVVDAVDVPVTLKIRTGLAPENRNGVEISKIAQSEGIAALTVHGRTRACKFGGQAEYDTIRQIKSAVSIPVIANGDINSLGRAQQVLSKTGADAVMIGRAALGQPWLPGVLGQALVSNNPAKELSSIWPTIATQQDTMLAHILGLYRLYGDQMGVRIARKHVKWYFGHFPDSSRWVAANNQLETPAQCISVIEDFYAQQFQRLAA